MRILLSFLFLFMWEISYSQELDVPIGGWEGHLPYQTGKWVTQSSDQIIYAAEQSLLFIDKEELSPTFFSKINGLSDTEITRVLFDSFNDQLIVIYRNSNIDLVDSEGVYNVSDIKDNKSIIGSKEIYDIHILDEETILLATAFGIVEYRSKNREFGSTVFTNIVVRSVSSLGSKIFAGTDDGLYFTDLQFNSNIADFNRWELLGQDHGLPLLYEARSVINHEDALFITDGRRVFQSSDGLGYNVFYEEPDLSFEITYLSSGSTYLMMGMRASQSSKVIYWDGNRKFPGSTACIDRLLYSIEDEKGQIWFADNFRNFRFTEFPTGGCQKLEYDSPLTISGSDIAISEGRVAVASGGVTDNFGDLFSRDGIYLLENNRWNNINESSYAPIRDNDMLNLYRVAFSPDGTNLILASFWNGFLSYNIESSAAIFYNKENTSLQGAIGDGRTRISDIEYDAQGRLWFSNYNAERPLSVWDTDGNWYSFATNSDRQVGDMTVDEAGNVWVTTFGTRGGLYVYNPGADISSNSDDQSRFFTLANSEITSSIIYTVATDLEGSVWVGTAEGAIVFECGGGVFEEDCRGERKFVLVDSIGAFLLETEEVRSIAFDGANRKWFGTRNGIFVQSPQGDEQILHLTAENSPLFDNEIVDMAFDGENGFMFISTNSGLQSLRTETTRARARHANKVFVFPNPVAPDYNGPIAIKGLAENAFVKITDIQGRVIYESQALGGQAIWDGNGLNGSRAETGVYLVFSTGTAGFGQPDSYVSKILFISE